MNGENEQYQNLPGRQKGLHKFFRPLLKSKVVQKITEAPVIKQGLQVLDMATGQGRYLGKKQETEVKQAQQQALNVKGTYDYLVGNKAVKDQLRQDALKYNPKIDDVIKAGKNVASLQNSMIGQQLASIESNMTQSRDQLSPNQRKAFKDFYDYKSQSLINYVKGGTAGKSILTDPNVTQYIAYRNKVDEAGTKLNFWEKAGSMLQGFISPYSATIGALDSFAGTVTGNEKQKESAKRTLANYFGRTDIMEDPSQFTNGDMVGEYFGRQMGWMDLFPVFGSAFKGAKTVMKMSKYGKAGEGLLEMGVKSFDKIGLDNFKTVFNTDEALSKYAKDMKFDIKKASKDDVLKFIQNNPGIVDPVTTKIARISEGLKEPASELGKSVKQYGTYFKYPKNITKDIIGSYYMMTPKSMKLMGSLFAAQVGTEAIGAATDSDVLRAAGGLFTNPIHTLTHMVGINKNMFLEKAFQEYADGYGYTTAELKALKDDDPLKMEIMKTADIMYNNTTVTQMLGWMPKTVLGKIIAGLGDSAIAFGGFAGNMKLGKYGLDKAGVSVSGMVKPTTKDGKLSIKSFADIESAMEKVSDINQKQAVLDKEVSNLVNKIQQGHQLDPIEGMKVSRLASESYAKMTELQNIASQVYGVRAVGATVERYKEALDMLLSNNSSIQMRVQATENMKQAHADMMTMVENASKTQGAEQFRADLMKETNRFLMSAQTLMALRDAQGITNSVTRRAIKNTAKAYHDFGPAILNKEISLNLATLRDGQYMANTINKTFKIMDKETKMIQEYFKEQVGGEGYQKRRLNQEIETAINQRLEQGLKNLKGSAEYEKLFMTIKSGVYNTLFEAMFFKYDPDNKGVDVIANNVLRHIFVGDSISDKTKLGEALNKLSGKKVDDFILRDIKDGAMRLSEDYLGDLKKNLDTTQQTSLENVKNIFQAIQGVSSIQRGLNTSMHMRAFLDIMEAPHQLEAIGMSIAGKDMMGKLYETYKDGGDADVVKFLQDNIKMFENNNALDTMDASTFVDYLMKSKDHIEDVFRQTDEALTKYEIQQQQLLAVGQKIANTLNGFGIKSDAIKTDAKMSPEDKVFVDTLKDVQNKVMDFRDRFTGEFDYAQRELSESEPGTIRSFDELGEGLKSPSYIVNMLQGKLKYDKSFKGTKGNTTLGTSEVIELAKKSSGESNFINKVLTSMGFDKEAKTYISENTKKYGQIVWDLRHNYRRYKDAQPIKVEVFDVNKPGEVEIKEDIILPGEGVENLGKLGRDVRYVSIKGLKPDVFENNLIVRADSFIKDIENRLGSDNIHILKNDTQADYIVMPKEKVRTDVANTLGKDIADKYDDNQLGQYATMKNMGLVDRILAEDPDFLRNPDMEKRAQVLKNSQKYVKKMNSDKVKDTTPRTSLILDDKGHIDGAVYLLSPDAKLQATKAGYDPDRNASGFKANVNGKGFEVKGYFFFGNPERIKSLLSMSNNKERAKTFLEQNGIVTKTTDQIVSGLMGLASEGKLDAVTLTSAIKDPMKGIEGYKGPIIPDQASMQWPGMRIYQDLAVKPKQEIIKLSHQYPQSIAGQRGEVFHKTLQDYMDKNPDSSHNAVKEILGALDRGDEKTVHELIGKNFNKLLAGDAEKLIEMRDSSGNIFATNSKNFQGILRSIIINNLAAHSLKGYRLPLLGLPKDIYDGLSKEYGLTDGNIIVLSKDYLGKGWKQGDHIVVGRDPVTGPKATIAAKVLMIENLPENLRGYFMVDGKPSQEIFTTGPALEKNMTQVLEGDYDGDRVYIYPEFSKVKPVEGKRNTIGDMMAEYTAEVQKIPSTWDTTSKAKRDAFKKAYGNAAYDYRTPGFAILNSKANVSLAASKARTASVLNRKIFDGAFKSDQEKIDTLNKFSKYIQEAVDGNLLDNKSSDLTAGIYRKLFPGLTKSEASQLDKDFSALFGFIKDKTEDGTTATLKQYLTKVSESQKALDRIIKLRADKTGQSYATLKKIAKSDPRVWLNNFDILKLDNYNPKDDKHWINKAENRMNNQKILQAGLVFDQFKEGGYNLPKAVEYIRKNNLRGSYDGSVRWELSSLDKRMFEALKNPSVALLALATDNAHLFDAVQKLHPEMYANYEIIRSGMTANEGYVGIMSDILNMQDKYKDMELKYFGGKQPEKFRGQFIPALLSRGVEGGNEVLKSMGMRTINIVDQAGQGKKTNLEAAADKVTMDSIKDPEVPLASKQKLQEEVTLRRAIGTFVEDQYRNIQQNMYEKKHAHGIKNTLFFDMYEFYRSADASILAKRDDPLKQYLRKVPGGEELYQNPGIPKYFRQVVDNMKNIMSADLLNKRMMLEHTKETKNYDNDLMKSLKKNLKDLTYDSMKHMRAAQASDLHTLTLTAMKDVQDIIFKDAIFVKNVSELMATKVKGGMKFEEARQAAVAEVSDKVSKNTIELSPATTDKIKDAMRASLSQLGQVTNKIIGDVSTQMRELATYSENPESLPKYIEMKMNNLLIEKAQKEGSACDVLGEFIATLNSVYKSTTLSYAPGRILTEGANAMFQTYVPYITSLFTGKGRRITTLESFKQKMGWTDSTLPALDKMSWDQIQKMFPEYNKVTTKVFETWKQRPAEQKENHMQKLRFYLQKGGERVAGRDIRLPKGKELPIVGGNRIPLGFESANQIFKEKMFTHEFYTNLHDVIVSRSENNPGYSDYVKRLFTQGTDLKPNDIFHKKALLKEVERLSTKNVKDNFFDYVNNPVWVAGLETYVPFANFFYNSAKIFAKNPVAWMGLLNTVSNIQADFSYPEFDIDEEVLRGYFNIHKFSIGILGALGFANAGVDLKRFLPIDVTNPQFFGYSYQKMFFPTNDPDYVKLMENKDYHRWNYGMNKLSPILGGFMESISTGDRRPGMKKLMYMFTGLSFKDTAKYDMLKAYYKSNYDDMLNKNSYYRNQFNTRRKANGLPEMSKEDLVAKKYFDELIFSGGDSTGYEYLNVMSDYITNTEFIKAGSNDIITDTDAADNVTKGVRGLLMDMATSALWETAGEGDGKKLFEKAKELADMTIDESGKPRKKTAGEKSILDRLSNMGTHKEFLERLNYYADNYNVIKDFSTANSTYRTDKGTATDNAKVAAFKFYFEEEETDPKWAKLEKSNPDLYYKTKVDAILNGTLRRPIQNEVLDEVGSERTLTEMYKEYLKHGKGIILTDLEKSKSNVNSYTLLKNMYRKKYYSSTNDGEKNYRKSMAVKAANELSNERSMFERFSPTFNQLTKLRNVIKDMPSASTFAEEMENYKAAVRQNTKDSFSKYYSGKKTWYNKFLNDKNATLRFKQTTGISIEDAIAQLEFDQNNLGMSTQTTNDVNIVSF